MGRFTFLMLIITILAGGVTVYEIYTSHFKLNRISEELKIVESIVELEKKVETLPEDSPSKKYFERLMTEAQSSSVEFSFQPGFPSRKFERILFQSAPWLLLIVLIFFTKPKRRGAAIAGVTLIGAPFIVLGYNLPVIEKMWVVNYLYPWVAFVVTLFLIVFLKKRKVNRH